MHALHAAPDNAEPAQPVLGALRLVGARLEVQRLAAALTLVHKYDCCGVRKVISHLAAKHFPKCSFIVPKRLSADGSADEEDALAPVLPISSWISQEHLEYMMRAQELFPDDETLLNPTCIAVLGHALSLGGVQWSECTRYANGYHFNHRAIEIVDSVEPVVVHVEPLNKKKKEEGDRASTTTSLPASSCARTARPLTRHPARCTSS